MATIPRYPKVSTQNLVRTPGFDFDVPSPLSQAVGRRMAEQQAADAKLADMNASPLDKAVSALKATASMGTMLFQAIQQAPKALQGEDAYTEAIGNAAYIPQDPRALEYMGDFGNMLEKLETEYKIPNLMPELVPFQPLAGLARTQVNQAVEQGATRAGMAAERALDKPVTDIMNRGGRGAGLLSSFSTNPAQVVKEKGGNWLSQGLDDQRVLGDAGNGRAQQIWSRQQPDYQARYPERQQLAVANDTVADWANTQLRKYMVNQMGTRDDPVRKLAEKNISHFGMRPDEFGEYPHIIASPETKKLRADYVARTGESSPIAESSLAQYWENLSDNAIKATTVGDIKNAPNASYSLRAKKDIAPYADKVPPETPIYNIDTGDNYQTARQSLGFNRLMDVMREDIAAGRISPEEVAKWDMEQAVRHVDKRDKAILKAEAEEADRLAKEFSRYFPTIKEYPDNSRWIELKVPDFNSLPKDERLQLIDKLKKEANEKGLDPEQYVQDYPRMKLEEALANEGEKMGHCVGSYCEDVAEGRTRIFSYRDANGDPHVTMEVIPPTLDDYAAANQSTPYRPAQSRIMQIKGKQDKRPVDQYIPFVQDFQRTTKYPIEGDFPNSGFDFPVGQIFDEDQVKTLRSAGNEVHDYLTKAEKEDLVRKLYERETGNNMDTGEPLNPPSEEPPIEGMKRGGRVHISDNPDTMALELNDKHLAGGGLLRKAAKLAMRDSDAMVTSARGASKFVEPKPKTMNVIKEKGGNWLSGSVEKAVDPLKTKYGVMTPEEIRSHQQAIETAKRIHANSADPAYQNAIAQMENEARSSTHANAINNWIDRNLTNYIKKEMATPEDPVRKLAEQGIVHIPSEQVGVNRYRAPQHREAYGGKQLGVSEAAKAWEGASDVAINAPRARTIKENESLYGANPWIDKLSNEERVYALNSPASYSSEVSGLGFDHIIDVLRQDVREGRIRPEQLNKVSMEQAVRRTYEFDQEQARKMAETQAKVTEGMPVHKEYPEGYKWIELAAPDSNKFEESIRHLESNPTEWQKAVEEFRENRQKNLESALKYEGDTMGHCVGGYCPDVLEGRSRIYSLRDKRGEPHVTIEVQPQTDVSDFSPGQIQLLRSHGKYVEQPSIRQIKGKQNRAPKEEYLPFVQDFVKSGQWSDVGDIQNTGLYKIDKDFLGATSAYMPEAEDIKHLKRPQREEALSKALEAGDLQPGYATRAEWEDAIRKHGRPTIGEADDELLRQLQPPEEGMKAGGKVHVSDNPDSMMMDMEDQKFAGGGAIGKVLSKLARAPAKSAEEIRAIAQRMAPQIIGEEFVRGEKGTQSVAGKTQKQFAREKELKHDIRPTEAERPTPEPVDLEKLKGSVMIGIPGDPTISGQTVHSVAGQPLVSPSPQHGGPLYGLGREDDAFWASGLGAANRVQNLAREAGQQYKAPVVGKYIMMGPESINYAQHFADANLNAIDPTKMRKSDIEGFNRLIRKGSPASGPRPAFPGIENPEEAYLQFAIDPELRKHFNSLMQMPTVTERFNLPSGQDVRHAITEPDLRNLETGVTGKSMGEMKPEITELGLSEHPTYSHDIPGKFLGSSEVPTPYELSFPDTLKAIQENPKQAAHEFGSLKMIGPRQIIDPQLIDELGMYREFIKQYTGKKDGGLIKVKRKAGGGMISKVAREALDRMKPAKAEMAARGAMWDKKMAEDASKYTRDIEPFNPSMEDIQAEIQRMQSKQDVQKATGGAVYNTNPDMSDGGQIIQGNAFKRGGTVRDKFKRK